MRKSPGFTMLELLLAISILAVVSSVAYFTFDAGVRAWNSAPPTIPTAASPAPPTASC